MGFFPQGFSSSSRQVRPKREQEEIGRPFIEPINWNLNLPHNPSPRYQLWPEYLPSPNFSPSFHFCCLTNWFSTNQLEQSFWILSKMLPFFCSKTSNDLPHQSRSQSLDHDFQERLWSGHLPPPPPQHEHYVPATAHPFYFVDFPRTRMLQHVGLTVTSEYSSLRIH